MKWPSQETKPKEANDGRSIKLISEERSQQAPDTGIHFKDRGWTDMIQENRVWESSMIGETQERNNHVRQPL
jgi:hypothetical protein